MSGAADPDPWLERWLPLLQASAQRGTVLELGCDDGRDTAWLAAHGFAVVGTDLSAQALHACARRVPTALLLQHDLRAPLPLADGACGAVLASLCLHYFDWATTEAIVARIGDVLRPGGVLWCRLNSVRDVLHGASGHEEIEPHYYRVHGRYAECKRFFDAADLARLFGRGWDTISCEERTIARYAQPKVAWELVLRKTG